MRKRARQMTWAATALVALAFVALMLVPTRALASEGAGDADSAKIDALVLMFQKYDVSTSGLQNTFEYLIVPQEEDAPLPEDENGKSFNTFTLTRNEELEVTIPVVVGASPEARSYTYHYELRPKTTELPDGLFYVDVKSTDLARKANVYYLEVFVQESNENPKDALVIPLVHIEGWDGPKVTDPGWRIGYQEAKDPEQDKDSDKDTAKKTTTTTNSGGTSGGGSSSVSAGTSNAPTARTADPLNPAAVLALVLASGASLALGVLMRRLKAGDDYA